MFFVKMLKKHMISKILSAVCVVVVVEEKVTEISDESVGKLSLRACMSKC